MGATNVKNPGDAIQDIELALDEEAEQAAQTDDLDESRRRLERTKTRGLGRMQLTVNYPRDGKDPEEVPFVRLSIDDADEILDELKELQSSDDASRGDIREFATGTLEEYCLDPVKDADHWASELTYGDAVGLCRNIAFGGNPPSA